MKIWCVGGEGGGSLPLFCIPQSFPPLSAPPHVALLNAKEAHNQTFACRCLHDTPEINFCVAGSSQDMQHANTNTWLWIKILDSRTLWKKEKPCQKKKKLEKCTSQNSNKAKYRWRICKFLSIHIVYKNVFDVVLATFQWHYCFPVPVNTSISIWSLANQVCNMNTSWSDLTNTLISVFYLF